MDSSKEIVGGSNYRRYSSDQKSKLEKAFQECPNPDESQRLKLAKKLGLDEKQIKYWFQNKRVKAKGCREQIESTHLRLENQRLRVENMMIKEILKKCSCISCGGPLLRESEHQLWLQNLLLENAQIQQQIDKMYKFLEPGNVTSQMSQPVLLPPTQPTLDQDIPSLGAALGQDLRTLNPNIPSLGQDIHNPTFVPALDPALNQDISTLGEDFGSGSAMHGLSHGVMLPQTMSTSADDLEKAKMAEVAAIAMEESLKLLLMKEPLWFKSVVDGKFILQRQSYERVCHRSNRFMGAHARLESSKDSKTVCMGVTQLLDMFLDAEKWVDLFPTIVKKAKTIQVLESGLSGHLQLMHAEMHSLSPLVPTRKFLFLRYCKQVEEGAWAIGDVSFDSSNHSTALYQTWRLPSGCLIKKLTHDSSMVTWVEHVEVDDKTQTHQLFRELICGNNVYGAERWVLTLERMCQRFDRASVGDIPKCDAGGVINLPEGRRSLMQLAHHMVKIFCGSLDMSENVDLTHLTKVNNGETRVSIRHNTMPGVPDGTIVSVATSFWIPLSPQTVFYFLKDSSKRPQWDILCEESPIYEMQRISNGTHPDNFTSILQVVQPSIHHMENMVILQESCVDPLGALLVYAPLSVKAINDVIMKGEQCSVLPYGFTISRDGRSNIDVGQSSSGHVGEEGGSLLTLLIQTLACTPFAAGQFNMGNVATVNEMAASIVDKIRAALNCPE